MSGHRWHASFRQINNHRRRYPVRFADAYSHNKKHALNPYFSRMGAATAYCARRALSKLFIIGFDGRSVLGVKIVIQLVGKYSVITAIHQ